MSLPVSYTHLDVYKRQGLRRLLREEICPVGVFVNEKPDQIVRLLQSGVIEAAQLHGQETEDDIAFIQRESGKKVIKAVQVTDGRKLAEWKDLSLIHI